MRTANPPPHSLTRYAWLSIGTALSTILLKTVAWQMSGSVGLLSDAIESLVNLAGALMALWMLTLAAQPADQSHPHGHGKAEYFSSAFEGTLILLAALSIGYTAILRLLNPQPLEAVGFALIVSALASILNFATARCLLRASNRYHSITLEADAHHLLTDVWTSLGVIVGVALVVLTDWLWLDPVIALLVAVNIVWTGYRLVRRSADGLMDSSLPAEQLLQIENLLADYRGQGLKFHALRTRQSGSRTFITLHVQVPGHWSVQQGHDQTKRIEAAIHQTMWNADITTHLEPLEEPSSASSTESKPDQEMNQAPDS
ncbi:MAG: cation diffusion facilitator family transporter [Betaproteobacteria bacterium]